MNGMDKICRLPDPQNKHENRERSNKLGIRSKVPDLTIWLLVISCLAWRDVPMPLSSLWALVGVLVFLFIHPYFGRRSQFDKYSVDWLNQAARDWSDRSELDPICMWFPRCVRFTWENSHPSFVGRKMTVVSWFSGGTTWMCIPVGMQWMTTISINRELF